MADFTVRIAAGVVSPMLTWTDPKSAAGKPSRVNPRPGTPHRRQVGNVNVEVRFAAVVSGVEAPLDTALGGRLFTAWVVQSPAGPLALTAAPGRSSLQILVPPWPGHYSVALARTGGGVEVLHLDVLP